MPEPHLGQHAGICRILQINSHSSGLLNRGFEIKFRPLQIGGKHYPLRFLIESSRQADPDPLKDHVRMCLHQVSYSRGQIFGRSLRIGRRRHNFLR